MKTTYNTLAQWYIHKHNKQKKYIFIYIYIYLYTSPYWSHIRTWAYITLHYIYIYIYSLYKYKRLTNSLECN